jgi:hypothetical protein
MKSTPEGIAARYKQETIASAGDVMEHVYKAVLGTPAFTLKDGTRARVDGLSPPEMNDDGELTCGFDVLLDDGTHLEFTMKNTGWGKSFAAAHAPNKDRQSRHR